eukprot:3024285-Rhodomonas_salina.1
MSGTNLANTAMYLRACYAMPGTDIAYGATSAGAAKARVAGGCEIKWEKTCPLPFRTRVAVFPIDFAVR